MRYALVPHAHASTAPLRGITVDAIRPAPRALALGFTATGDIAALRLPPLAAPERADELWRHTCFEAFVQIGDGYYELNFAPSRQWAAYAFDDYRAGMRNADVSGPQIVVSVADALLSLRADVTLPPGAERMDWRLGLAAVIEDAHGEKNYWALAHPAGKPDFHHPNGFVGVLPSERT